jgi:signal transduction histidine kinase
VRGPLRPIAERLYLLARSPLAWVLPAGLWAIGYFSTIRQDLIGMLSLLLSFATLVAAGWFGWQRPTLYGAAAAGLGVLALGAFLLWGASTQGYLEELLGPILIEVFVRLLPIQLVIGFVAGWYGGYLRRRAAQVNRSPRPQRR